MCGLGIAVYLNECVFPVKFEMNIWLITTLKVFAGASHCEFSTRARCEEGE